MAAVVLVIEIVLCLFSLFMIAVVLLQSGKSAGLTGDIAGGAETFLGKSKAKTYEGTLKKLTKVAAVGIMVRAIALVLIQVYVLPNVADTQSPQATPAVTVDADATAESADAAADVTPGDADQTNGTDTE
jgi:preprotein translocase subunit SecG